MKVSKNFSKVDEMTLTICRERVQDACRRVSDVSDILAKRGWSQAGIIADSAHVLNQLVKELEGIEHELYELKYKQI